MAKVKLTLTVVKNAEKAIKDYELRDTAVPGFLVKITPAGRKIFMVAYVASNGIRRKPTLGRFGELTVEQARDLAKDWLAEVRRGKDPSASRSAARQSPTMGEFFERFMTEYSEVRNKPSTIRHNRGLARTHLLPALGDMKVIEVSRRGVVALMTKRAAKPTNANHLLCLLRKMLNMAEVWELRPDGSNPCRHIQKYPQRGSTRLIIDAELKRLYEYLDRADKEGLEHPFITLAIPLQFEFAARMSVRKKPPRKCPDMRARSQEDRHFPTRELLERAEFAEDAGIIRFVDTEAAARLLNLMPHTLESYRSLGGGPDFYKFGRWASAAKALVARSGKFFASRECLSGGKHGHRYGPRYIPNSALREGRTSRCRP